MSLALHFLFCQLGEYVLISGPYPGIQSVCVIRGIVPVRGALASACGDPASVGPGWGPGSSADFNAPPCFELLP